jgi:hypothetical protein
MGRAAITCPACQDKMHVSTCQMWGAHKFSCSRCRSTPRRQQARPRTLVRSKVNQTVADTVLSLCDDSRNKRVSDIVLQAAGDGVTVSVALVCAQVGEMGY